MVWAAFSGAGKWTIAFIEGRQDALGYHNTLENYMMPFVYCFHGEKFTFQQDGASIHTANVTKEWFKSLDIDLLDWRPFGLACTLTRLKPDRDPSVSVCERRLPRMQAVPFPK